MKGMTPGWRGNLWKLKNAWIQINFLRLLRVVISASIAKRYKTRLSLSRKVDSRFCKSRIKLWMQERLQLKISQEWFRRDSTRQQRKLIWMLALMEYKSVLTRLKCVWIASRSFCLKNIAEGSKN